MPDSALFVFACPICEESMFCRSTMTVDAAVAPQVRVLLMRGLLNTFLCEGCGHRGVTPIPLLYRDRRLGLALGYAPPEVELGADELALLQQASLVVHSMSELAQRVKAKMESEQGSRPAPGMYRKGKMEVLRRIAQRFEAGREYTDSEVTTTIHAAMRSENQGYRSSPAYAPDHLRLGLVELGLLCREPDGSRYWVAA